VSEETGLEKVFLDALRSFPNMAEDLKNDMSFTLENEFVEKLVELLVQSKFDEAVLAKVENHDLFTSTSAQAIENGQDFLLQAILASPETPPKFLLDMIERKPELLTDGWLYIQRLGQNSNCPPELLIKATSVAIELEDIEICELLVSHPNIPDSALSDLETFLE
jgi:hypothetical protein